MREPEKIQDVLASFERFALIDVRSPAEFEGGHIPGAVNIPLFTNEERATIGTLYTQVSREAAMEEGLVMAGPKMKSLVQEVRALVNQTSKKILLYCWRGGNRSKAMEWLFNFSGIPVLRLAGGYKSFRQALHDFFDHGQYQLHILGGCTGAGKTEILSHLKDMGAQVIDLENLANHKGSAFGTFGEAAQLTTEQFENNLFLEFLKLDLSQPVWLENESKSIGKNHIPDGLWNKMRNSKLFAIEVSKEARLKRILKYYAEPIDIEKLKESFERIRKRLGGLDFQNAMKALDHHDLESAASIALTYYDKAYRFQLESWPEDKLIHLEDCDDVEAISKNIFALTASKKPEYNNPV